MGGRRPRWVRRVLFPVVALLSGVIATVTTAIGFDDPSPAQVAQAILIGLGTAVLTALLEYVVSTNEEPEQADPAGPVPRKGWRERLALLRGKLSRLWQVLDPHRIHWTVRPEIAPLPDEQSIFRKRPQVIEELVKRHDERRSQLPSHRLLRLLPRRRKKIAKGSPLVVVIHGKPGCGKSEIGVSLAHKLLPRYPGGAVYANLGTAGSARPAAEILRTCLEALRWPANEIPTDATECAKLMRSLTDKRRILFFFDATRHHDQLRQVLPAGSGCCVIVTSRRRDIDPTDGVSYQLNEPDMDESLDILRSAAQLEDESRPIAAAEVVEFCGRLPLALRSAGEQVTSSGADLGNLAEMLRAETTRLENLDSKNRKVLDRVSSEYRRLLPDERRALQWLSLVPDHCFDGQALQILLNVPEQEAEDTVARLAEVRLLDIDPAYSAVPGAVRYQFAPLVKLLARQELDESTAFRDSVPNRKDALASWDSRRVPRFEEAVERYYKGSPDHCPQAWLDLVRAEYPSLVRAIHATSNATLRWQLAAMLTGCVPAGVDADEAIDAIELGIVEAQKERSLLGELDTLLSKASLLIGLERYGRAWETLESVRRRVLESLPSCPEGERDELNLRHAIAHRKWAEALLQAAAYADAGPELQKARVLAREARNEAELRMIAMLQAELHHVAVTPLAMEDVADGRVNDAARFRYNLTMCEAERRLEHWRLACAHLENELALSQGDQRRAARLNYRLARLFLDWWGKTSESHRELARVAVRRSADALLLFARLGDHRGVTRARCLLARAMAAGGLFTEARLECDQAGEEIEEHVDPADIAYLPLRARLCRARGELLLRQGDRRQACHELLTASKLFRRTGDWSSQTTVNKILTQVSAQGFPHGVWPSAVPSQKSSKQEATGAQRIPSQRQWMSGLRADDDGGPGPDLRSQCC